MATCRCGAQCRGGLCRQCEIEEEFAHLADELAEREEEEADDA